MNKNEDLIENETGAPHEMREAQFILAGKKEVAYFCFDYPEEHFQEIRKLIENDTVEILKIDWVTKDFDALKREVGTFPSPEVEQTYKDIEQPYKCTIVYVPTARDKALKLAELMQCSWKYGYVESVEREIGQILGYSQESTDRYIENLKKQYPNLPKFPPPEASV